MSKHRDWWDGAYTQALWIGYFALAVMAGAIVVEIRQHANGSDLVSLVCAWVVMMCVIPALKMQRLMYRLEIRNRTKQQDVLTQRSLSEHGGDMAFATQDEFLAGVQHPRQCRWLWDRLEAESELRAQVRDAFEESEVDPNNRTKWNRLIAQLWGRMAEADVTLVEDFPMPAMHFYVPWIAGGVMMRLVAATGKTK